MLHLVSLRDVFGGAKVWFLMIKINEIFFSIQGESSLAGHPTVFIRTSGCHLRCTYCDTTYAYYDGTQMTEDNILAKVAAYPTKYVCVTGGEPLLQKEVPALLVRLCDLGYFVSVETSGDLSCKNIDPRVLLVIDIKTPDSGEADKFHADNLHLENVNHEFKFVICSEKDFFWSLEFIAKHNLNCQAPIFFSPAHGEVSPQWLAEKILSSGAKGRLQLQQHKYIWSPETRGV
jgi:7-carboxy-7-deazaguanine synthase